MYNNVLLSYRSFLLTVSSIASCISNCTIVGFVSRPCKKMAQQGFPFSHLETACWAISVERLYRYLPTCPASYKKQTDDNTSGKLPVRSIALLEVPASIFPISRSETSHILFCSYELLCYRYHEMQFYILALQGRISTRTSGPVDTQRLPRLRRLLRKLSAIGCRVLDRICTRLYLTQIARRSANGYRAM